MKTYLKFTLAVIGAALLFCALGFVLLTSGKVPSEAELGAVFVANRAAFECFGRQLKAQPPKAQPPTPDVLPDLLPAARTCGLNNLVHVRRWEGSHPWRLVVYEKRRFSALTGIYEVGFAFADGSAPRTGEQIVSAFPSGPEKGESFVPLEDGWALFETNF